MTMNVGFRPQVTPQRNTAAGRTQKQNPAFGAKVLFCSDDIVRASFTAAEKALELIAKGKKVVSVCLIGERNMSGYCTGEDAKNLTALRDMRECPTGANFKTALSSQMQRDSIDEEFMKDALVINLDV